MFRLNSILIPAVAYCALALSGCSSESSYTYQQYVEPIIKEYCSECHLEGGKGLGKSGFRVDSYDHVMKGTNLGKVITPGKAISSTLYLLVAGKADRSISMPHDKRAMDDQKVSIIRDWIDQGANK